MASDFSVKFLGSRGSIPVSGQDHVRYGGATSCVRVRAGTREIILDAGSGILQHSSEVMGAYASDGGPLRTYVFMSHTHLDHLIGLPYYGPLYVPDSVVNLWGPRSLEFDSFGESIEAFIRPPFFPVPLYEMAADVRFSDISQTDVVYFLKGIEEPIKRRPMHPDDAVPDPDEVEVSVRTLRGYNHPKSGVNLYKLEFDGRSVVYATDTEGYPSGDRRLVEFARGADVLIHDAMYTEEDYTGLPAPTQGFGHATVEVACDVARRANVDRLFLVHHDPSHGDETLDEMAALGSSYFENAQMVSDGLEVEV